MLHPRRVAKACALLALGAAAGVAVSGLTPAGAPEAAAIALGSLGSEIFLLALALAGAALGPGPIAARLGLGPGALGWTPQVLLVVGAVAASHGLDGVLELSGLREGGALARIDAALVGVRGRALALALVGMGLAPGIAEEVLCRGLVQRELAQRLGPALGVLLAAAFFGALHGDAVHATFAGVLGLYLGTAAQLAGSVRVAIAGHCANNLLAVAVAALAPGPALATAASALAGFSVALACLAAAWR